MPDEKHRITLENALLHPWFIKVQESESCLVK